MLRKLLLLTFLTTGSAGCGWLRGGGDGGTEEGARKGKKRRGGRADRRADRREVTPGTPRLAAGAIPEGSPRRLASTPDGPMLDELPEGMPGLVVLAVMDTVRADRLSSCGHERPTSPHLQALVDRGAVLSCEAYAPATWTTPSHASYFTGLQIEEHTMLRKGLVLSEDATTLAEIMAERGYQTLFISGNPVLKKATGLTQGFHRVRVAPGLVSRLRAEGLAKMLRMELSQIDPRRPVFLFVNIFDAHEPYAPIPEGVDWVEPQKAVLFKPSERTDDNPYFQFMSGEMSPEVQADWLADVRDGYDHAVSIADASLGRIVRVLERHKLGQHGVRMVVTSDHGENLGEHGLVRHDGPPWQSTTRVPFLVYDTTRSTPLELPEPLAATSVFHLLTEGTLPSPPLPVRSGSIGYTDAPDPRFADALATWPTRARKLMWIDGRLAAYDVAADPAEVAPLPLTPAEEEDLSTAVEAWKQAKDAAMGREVDGRVVELLEGLGYAE